MPSYAAFGLSIDSEIPLPELPETRAPADIVIRLGSVPKPPMPAGDNDDYIRLSDDRYAFHTPHGGFLLTAARELTVDPSPGITPTLLRLVILGRALGALLQWRGRFVLHASSVAHGGRARVVAGASGSGKSTTAAAHIARGWHLVADDLVVIDLDGDEPRVLPAYPQLRLWPDAAASLGIEIGSKERVHRDHDKRIVPIEPGDLASESLPIESIVILKRDASDVLDPSEHNALERPEGRATAMVVSLDRQAALVELLRHSYAPRIMRALGRQAEHMAQCARLAGSVVIARASLDTKQGGPIDAAILVELLDDGVRDSQKTFGITRRSP